MSTRFYGRNPRICSCKPIVHIYLWISSYDGRTCTDMRQSFGSLSDTNTNNRLLFSKTLTLKDCSCGKVSEYSVSLLNL